ncbi:MAG: hypothetical protein PHR35_18945 [Kiritimatiellae bacterium]|nr:hypothetical protein [Kiritimatiellia bacterium]
MNRESTPEEKVALFRSLFRGRDDVYPRRFESRKTGKCGNSPACANEWVRGLCERRTVKCMDCPNRRFIPVTDATVRDHLMGMDSSGREFVMGLYPMRFLAEDVGKHLNDVLDTILRGLVRRTRVQVK